MLQGLLCKPCKNRFLSHCSTDLATWPRKFILEATVRYLLQMLIRRSIRSFTIPPPPLLPFPGKFEPCASVITKIMIHQIFLLACHWSKHSTFPNMPQLKLGDIWDYDPSNKFARQWLVYTRYVAEYPPEEEGKSFLFIKFVPENTHKRSSLAGNN